MKYILAALLIVSFSVSCFNPAEDPNKPCYTDSIGYLTVKNNTTGDHATSMDIYIGDLFKERIAPQQATKRIELKEASYRVEGADTLGVRTWGKNINIVKCEELEVVLGE